MKWLTFILFGFLTTITLGQEKMAAVEIITEQSRSTSPSSIEVSIEGSRYVVLKDYLLQKGILDNSLKPLQMNKADLFVLLKQGNEELIIIQKEAKVNKIKEEREVQILGDKKNGPRKNNGH